MTVKKQQPETRTADEQTTLVEQDAICLEQQPDAADDTLPEAPELGRELNVAEEIRKLSHAIKEQQKLLEAQHKLLEQLIHRQQSKPKGTHRTLGLAGVFKKAKRLMHKK